MSLNLNLVILCLCGSIFVCVSASGEGRAGANANANANRKTSSSANGESVARLEAAPLSRIAVRFRSGTLMPAAATYFYLRHVQISDSISCQNLSCIAAQYALGKQSLPKKTKLRPGGVNPASIFCQDLGGEPKVGILENDDEVSICLFKDGSSAFAWDMLHKRDLGH